MVTIMTIAAAWLAQRADGREHLYIASDSRLSGGQRLDACPKILTLPRSDCALCFAGDTAATYPLMIQMAYAISAHEPARERSLDIARVKANLIRVFSDLVARITDAARPFQPHDAEFIFAGYSWMKKEFRIWNIHYVANEKKFAAREAHSFHPPAAEGGLHWRLVEANSRSAHSQVAAENADYWTVDPFTGQFSRPRKFGHRISAAAEVAGES